MFFPKFGWGQYIWRKCGFAWGPVKKWWERKLIGVWGDRGWSEMVEARQLSLYLWGAMERVGVPTRRYVWVKANLFYVATFSRALVATATGDATVGATSCMVQWSSGRRTISQQCHLKVCILHCSYSLAKCIIVAFLDFKLSILMLLFSLTSFSFPLVDWEFKKCLFK